MDVFPSLEEAGAAGALRGGAVIIGNMDGVHLGHRRLVEVALARSAAAGLLTFAPHPVQVLRPERAPPLLTPLPRKLELLASLGLRAVVVQPFDRAYAATSAAEFVARDLAGRLGVAEVVVGENFTAGHERARVDALRPLLAARGIGLQVVEPVTADGLVVSSSKVREFVLVGNVQAAAELLARPYDVDGVVVRGAGRGRGFGFATANLRTDQLLPGTGVYVVAVRLGREGLGLGPRPVGGQSPPPPRELAGVCNVGVKPTVESAGGVTAEVHLLDFDGRELYGEPLRVGFLRRLREERRFPSVEALRAQIGRDVDEARRFLGLR